jgi:hypothetical protein
VVAINHIVVAVPFVGIIGDDADVRMRHARGFEALVSSKALRIPKLPTSFLHRDILLNLVNILYDLIIIASPAT